MKKQQGAALIIVLALLAGSLMLGLSGMNSALIDERLAGNYRASALAQMAAEWGGSGLDSSDIDSSNSQGNCSALLSDGNAFDMGGGGDVDSLSSYKYVTCNNDSGGYSLLVRGQVLDASSVSFILLIFPGGIDIDDFFEWVDDNSNSFFYACDSAAINGPGVYYCNGDFTDKTNSSFDGVTLIVSGNFDSNVQDDISGLTVIVKKMTTFKGIGNDDVGANIWSGGEVTMSGDGAQAVLDLEICAPDARVDGVGDADNNNCEWVEVFLEDSDYEGGSTDWVQL
ncbi:hypothetical protein LG290_01700 [Halomonas sediminis]